MFLKVKQKYRKKIEFLTLCLAKQVTVFYFYILKTVYYVLFYGWLLELISK